MKIIAVGSRFSGVSYHRLFMPLRFMDKTYLMMTDQLTEEEIWEANRMEFSDRRIFTLNGFEN